MGNTPYFEWYKTRTGQFRWRLKGANHEKLASGESYKRKQDMMDTLSIIDPRGLWPMKEVNR
jgi:uncharacterized protein YegP (UPF0339 family)